MCSQTLKALLFLFLFLPLFNIRFKNFYFSAWLPNDAVDNSLIGESQPLCLGIQWVSSRTETGLPASGLYWTPQPCKNTGGYVCKKRNQGELEIFNFENTNPQNDSSSWFSMRDNSFCLRVFFPFFI